MLQEAGEQQEGHKDTETQSCSKPPGHLLWSSGDLGPLGDLRASPSSGEHKVTEPPSHGAISCDSKVSAGITTPDNATALPRSCHSFWLSPIPSPAPKTKPSWPVGDTAPVTHRPSQHSEHVLPVRAKVWRFLDSTSQEGRSCTASRWQLLHWKNIPGTVKRPICL